MSNIYSDNKYVGKSIGISRVFQESFSAASGVTGYGKVANFIGTNIEQIDRMAEYLGEYAAKASTDMQYTNQYGKSGIFGRIKRTFTSSDKAWENQSSRRNQGAIVNLAVQSGIKLGSRLIQRFTSEKEKNAFFEQVYRILLVYAMEDSERISPINLQRETRELNKIRNSFPISANARLKLADTSVGNFDAFSSEFTIFNLKDSERIKENISYLLYVLYAQKYGESTDKESRLLEYYSLLGYNYKTSKEMIRENKDTYDTVTDDQLKYLMLSRHMLKNIEPNMPTIDLNQIKVRADEMANNDPYRVRKRMVVKPTVSSNKTIADILFYEPEIAIQAGSAAIAQLELDDNSKEEVRNTMVNKWGFDESAFNNVISQADGIKKESNEV